MALTPFCSSIIADVGISMGDEGKGRVVAELIEELSERPDAGAVGMVLKVNGGANSGHTVDGLKLNLLPAGTVDASVAQLALGSGVVADPRKVLWEIALMEAQGHAVRRRLCIDTRTLVSDVSHRLLDLAWEDYREHQLQQTPRGSTGRGITPAYQDEVSQMQIFYGEILSSPKDKLAAKLKERLSRALKTIRHVCEVHPRRWEGFLAKLTEAETHAHQAAIKRGLLDAADFDFRAFGGAEPFTLDTEAVVKIYLAAWASLRESIVDVRECVLENLQAGRSVIGEFGQAYWLDKRAGFVPNVTASHAFTPELFESAGIPVQPVHVVGCAKAYDTKVGTHVFLTQMPEQHPLAEKLRTLEFGSSTGRQRQVGWFDAVEKGDCLRYGGFQDWVMNKLDALSWDVNGDPILKVCTAYKNAAGEIFPHVPRDESIRQGLCPVYAELAGWREPLGGVRRFEDLPRNAQRYVAFCLKAVMDVAECSVHAPEAPNLRYIGVGPARAQIIKDVPSPARLLGILDGSLV